MTTLWAAGALLATAAERAPAQALVAPGRPAPALTRVFTPRGAPPGAFTVTVLGAPLGSACGLVQQTLAPELDEQQRADRCRSVPTPPLDALGDTAPYDRARVARLYLARRTDVVRMPLERQGRVVGAVTLISPFPDATLSHLEPGTLVILFDVAAARNAGRH